MTLPETEVGFYFAAVAQLEPALRPVFAERVARFCGAHPIQVPATSTVRCGRRWSGYGRRRRSPDPVALVA